MPETKDFAYGQSTSDTSSSALLAIRRALIPLPVRRAFIEWRRYPSAVVLDRIAAIVKEDIVVEVGEFGGSFSISPRSHLLRRILEFGYYEPYTSRIFGAFIEPEKDVLDVGANIGFYTVAGAKRLTSGRVFAAEPTTGAFDRLSKNVARNGTASRVILFKGMVGSGKGEGKIHFIPGMEEYSSMGALEHAETKERQFKTEIVPMERLDDLVEVNRLHPAVIKVDVEGAEFSVFSGAQRTIATFRPVIISEIWRNPTTADGHAGAEIIQMFSSLDYVIKNAQDPAAKPGLDDIGGIVCIPRERFDPAILQP